MRTSNAPRLRQSSLASLRIRHSHAANTLYPLHESVPREPKCRLLLDTIGCERSSKSLRQTPNIMSRYVRVSKNYVNLGRLYSIPPWGTGASLGPNKPSNNTLNLGNLYADAKHRRPPGWAYFDDGSIFITPSGWLPHHILEERMQIAAHFVNQPSPKLQAIRQQDPHKKRLILIR